MFSKEPVLLSFQDVFLKLGSASSFGGVDQNEILHGISFDVRKGEVLGIAGRNGAGKSLICRLAAGALLPTGGHVEFNAQHRLLLTLGQYVNDLMRVDEQLMAVCAWNQITGSAAEEAVERSLAFSEISHLSRHPMGALSSGERAKALFSLALMIQVDLLIIDETMSVGDIDFRRKSRAKVAEYLNHGGTALLVSHNTSTLKTFCTRLLHIEEGNVVASGDVDEVIESYLRYSDEKGSVSKESRSIDSFKPDEIVDLLIEREIYGDRYVIRGHNIDVTCLQIMRTRYEGKHLDSLIDAELRKA
jgi:ABC-type polysaccharide/polyol phosphate transport system ATPase subunit